MLEQHIQQHFIDSADLHYQVSQEISDSVANAVYALLACVTSGNKVMCCGNGLSWAQAAQFAAMCVSGMDRERPELAAMLIDSGPLLAPLNAADHWHAPVAAWLQAHPDVALPARRVPNQAAQHFLKHKG